MGILGPCSSTEIKIASVTRQNRWRIDANELELDMTHPVNLVLLVLDEAQLHAQACEACLPEEEKSRARKFIRAADRNRFIAGRTLARLLLARQLNLSAPEVPLSVVNGRPFLNETKIPANGRYAFNISHSGCVVALAWSGVTEIGVDVEECRRFANMDEVAFKVMGEEEQRMYRLLDSSARLDAFYRLWVRKEAIMKQMHAGFSLEPTRISLEGLQYPPSDQPQSSIGKVESQVFHLLMDTVSHSGPKTFWALASGLRTDPGQLRIQYSTAAAIE